MGTCDPAALEKAAKATREIKDKLGQYGDLADASTKQAGTLLSDQHFALGGAMAKTAETWWFQVNTLYKACASLEAALAACAKNNRAVEDQNSQRLNQLTSRFQ
ncbi:hypothetical protein [Flindersiella endophytica]